MKKLVVTLAVILHIGTSGLAQEIRTFKLISKAGRLQPTDGGPYILAFFTEDGNSIPGISANFRSTRFDISGVAENLRNDITIGGQADLSTLKTTHEVFVDATKLTSFFIDKDNIVFPPSVSQIEQNGPYIKMIFYAKPASSDTKPKPLEAWDVIIEQTGEFSKGKLTSSGIFDVSNVKLAPLRWSLIDSNSLKVYKSVCFPVFRGAIKDLVVYEVWDINTTLYEQSYKDVQRSEQVKENILEIEARVDTVKQITDQNKLAEIAKNDIDWRLRLAAVQKLTDQDLLMEISSNDKEALVRMAAFQRLEALKK